ncbi:MAG TPA: hypothetical protein VJL28_11415 [Gemmatimonadaceae bacterium]|nr:hypothetical protein [Gemmatimonadaceae bacterium]
MSIGPRAGILLTLISSTAVTAAAPAPQPPVRWTLDATPALTLGANERDTVGIFQTVLGATRLPDGSILVGDRGEFALRLFGPTGAPLRSFARIGSGPGEVQRIAGLLRCGDSIYAHDSRQGNLYSVFTLAGRFVRSFRFASPQSGFPPYQTACNGRGDFVHLGYQSPRDIKAGPYRSTLPVWLSGADSAIRRLIDSVPGWEAWGQVRDGRMAGARALPLSRQPVLGAGRTQFYVGSGDQFRIRALDSSGREVAVLQRTASADAVSEADVRNEMEREISIRGESWRRRTEQDYAEMKLPTTLPPYTILIVDESDYVWVRPWPRAALASLRWSVFDPRGRLAAEVDVPAFLEVFEIGREYLLGRYFDPNEAVPQVRLYRLRR